MGLSYIKSAFMTLGLVCFSLKDKLSAILRIPHKVKVYSSYLEVCHYNIISFGIPSVVAMVKGSLVLFFSDLYFVYTVLLLVFFLAEGFCNFIMCC